MSIFPGPDELLPGTKALEQMSKDFAALMPRDFAGSVNLMAHPAAGVAAFSALGFGIASHALGVWVGTAAGAAEVSRRLFMPVLDEVTADDFRDKRRTPAKRARAATEALIADARAITSDAAAAPAKSIDVLPDNAGSSAAMDEAQPRAEEVSPARPVAAPTPEVAKDVAQDFPADVVQVSVAKVLSGEVSASASSADPIAADLKADLMPEDFRQPKALDRPETPDDLKLISGIGPKLEKVLNGLGIWTYAQIAGWSSEEIAWVDDYLSFKGRIGRDGWLEQASGLAKGAMKH